MTNPSEQPQATSTATPAQQQQQPQQPQHEPEHVITSDFEPKRVIVLPVDGSKSSLDCIHFAIEKIVNKETDQVVLLNVRPYAFPDMAVGYPYAPYAFSAEQLGSMDEHSKKQSHQLLQQLAKNFQKENIHVRAVALIGDARNALETKINTLNPTMVIMGNRGLGPVSRVFLGSVSQHLVHHSKSPVLIVPCQPNA